MTLDDKKSVRTCRYVYGEWHAIHDDGSQGFCGAWTKECSGTQLVCEVTCKECIELLPLHRESDVEDQ